MNRPPKEFWDLPDALSGVRTRELCTFDILGRSSDKS